MKEQETRARRIKRLERKYWQDKKCTAKYVLKELWPIALIIGLVLFFASCSSYDVVLHPSGTVKEVDGNRVLVEFPTQEKGGYGVAWFWIPGSNEGDKVKLRR